YLLSVRNVAKWSWPVVAAAAECPETWQVFSNLGARLMGLAGMPEQAIDDFIFRKFAEGAVDEACPWPGLTVDEVVEKVAGAIGAPCTSRRRTPTVSAWRTAPTPASAAGWAASSRRSRSRRTSCPVWSVSPTAGGTTSTRRSCGWRRRTPA